MELDRKIVVLAGPSGVGKTYGWQRAGLENVLQLDSFYKSASPTHPRWLGQIDWENIATFDLNKAVSALIEYSRRGTVSVPIYDLALDRVAGSKILNADRTFVVAEGMFGVEVAIEAKQRGLRPRLVVVDHTPLVVAWERVRRDVKEGRLPSWYAWGRSLRLLVRHKSYLKAAKGAGAMAVSRKNLASWLRSLPG